MQSAAWGSARAARGEGQLFNKTRLCTFFLQKRCRRGVHCTFAHSEEELRAQPDFYKTQLCIDFFRSGACPFGPSCRYAHNPDEVRCSNVPPKNSGSSSRREARTMLCQPRQEIQSVQAQISALQAELQALREQSSGRLLPVAPSATCAKEGEENDIDLLPASQGFSRQSTEEGQAQHGSSGMLATERDDWDDASWYGDFELEVQPAEIGIEKDTELEEAIPCELVVHNSFLSLVPSASASPAACRRCVSAPPARR